MAKKRKNLQNALAQHRKKEKIYRDRRLAWANVLKNIQSDVAIDKIADLLARFEFEPNERGIPCGNWPSKPKMDPRIWLAFITSTSFFIEKGTGLKRGKTKRQLEWKANIFLAATLVWAGAIKTENVRNEVPFADLDMVRLMLEECDLEKYWHETAKGQTKEDICLKWEQGEFFVDAKKIGDMIRYAEQKKRTFD